MQHLKELAVDALILLAGWFIVTAGQLSSSAKGVSCGRAEITQQAPKVPSP